MYKIIDKILDNRDKFFQITLNLLVSAYTLQSTVNNTCNLGVGLTARSKA